MAEEEVAASLAPSDHKRKLEDLEPEAPKRADPSSEEPTDSNGDCDAALPDLGASDEAGAKRPRLDDQPDGSGMVNLGDLSFFFFFRFRVLLIQFVCCFGYACFG